MEQLLTNVIFRSLQIYRITLFALFLIILHVLVWLKSPVTVDAPTNYCAILKIIHVAQKQKR